MEQPTYRDKVMGAMPSLTILDGKRLDGQRGGKGKYRWKEDYKGPQVLKEPGAAALVSLRAVVGAGACPLCGSVCVC